MCASLLLQVEAQSSLVETARSACSSKGLCMCCSYVITSPSFPSDLGSGAVALSMCLCGAKLALRLHELLRTAGARNPSLSRRKHYRDNDRAATVRCESESGGESAHRSSSEPDACRAPALPRQRSRKKMRAASAPWEGSFALIWLLLDRPATCTSNTSHAPTVRA